MVVNPTTPFMMIDLDHYNTVEEKTSSTQRTGQMSINLTNSKRKFLAIHAENLHFFCHTADIYE